MYWLKLLAVHRLPQTSLLLACTPCGRCLATFTSTLGARHVSQSARSVPATALLFWPAGCCVLHARWLQALAVSAIHFVQRHTAHLCCSRPHVHARLLLVHLHCLPHSEVMYSLTVRRSPPAAGHMFMPGFSVGSRIVNFVYKGAVFAFIGGWWGRKGWLLQGLWTACCSSSSGRLLLSPQCCHWGVTPSLAQTVVS